MSSVYTKGTEVAFDFHCDLCDKDNNYVEAIRYCVNCKDYLCQDCYNNHRKSGSWQYHVLLDKKLTFTSQKQNKNLYSESCAIHKHETLQYYCADHDQSACGVCITLHHRNCEGVDNIHDIAGNVLSSREYKDTILKMKSLTKEAQQAINTTQSKSKTTNLQHFNASEFFKQMRNELLDRLEHLTLKEAVKVRDENQKKIKFVEDQSNKLLNDTEALGSKLTSLENKGQHCQMFLIMKRSQDVTAALESSLLQLQYQSNITEYLIKMSDGLQYLIQQPEKMASLEITNSTRNSSINVTPGGLSSRSETPQKEAPGHILNQHEPTAAKPSVMETKKNKKSTAVHVADIKVDIKNNDACISGSVVLPGEKLVLVDHGNKKVRLVNLQNHKTVSLPIREPWDITAITNTQVAVTCPHDRTILFINVINSLTLDHKETIKGKCWGIACISDKLVITYCDSAKVEIISQKGELLQTVVTEERGKQLFSSPNYVTISPDQQTIYISDMNRHTVTSLDPSGKVKTIFKDDELKRPCGPTIDKTGALYVCGRWSYNMHQLTPDLHKIQISIQGIIQPSSVSYSEKQNKLYIGMMPSGIVKVYQLQ